MGTSKGIKKQRTESPEGHCPGERIFQDVSLKESGKIFGEQRRISGHSCKSRKRNKSGNLFRGASTNKGYRREQHLSREEKNCHIKRGGENHREAKNETSAALPIKNSLERRSKAINVYRVWSLLHFLEANSKVRHKKEKEIGAKNRR